MKRLLLLILLFAGILCDRCVFAGIWQDRTLGLSDAEFYSIAGSPDDATVYVGTCQGLYMMGPNENEWKQVFACRGQYKGVKHICLAPDGAIYIATKNGLFASRDHGQNWRRIFRGLAGKNYCTYVTCRGQNTDTIYLGTLKGLFWTKDRGKTWASPAGILGSASVNAIAVGKEPDAEDVFVICDNELYKSGTNFENYEKVFAADSLDGFQSDDEEDSYEAVSEDLEVVFLLNHAAVKNNILYLATSKGLFGSEDAGNAWFRFEGAGLLNRWINYVTPSGEGDKVYAATRGGIFEYKKATSSWSEMYGGMDSKSARQVVAGGKGSLWALCKRRLYKMDHAVPSVTDAKFLNADRILGNFKNEPTINETMAMAIDYAEVYPEKIKRWRRQVKFKGLFPKLNIGIDRGWSDTYEIYTSSKDAYLFNGPQDRTEGWDLNLSWDLSDLIWSNSQTTIDIRSKLMVQLRDDIVDEVNRAYFERRRLQIELLTDPPRAMAEILKKRLRIQELTATLDGLTGSRFSKAFERE